MIIPEDRCQKAIEGSKNERRNEIPTGGMPQSPKRGKNNNDCQDAEYLSYARGT